MWILSGIRSSTSAARSTRLLMPPVARSLLPHRTYRQWSQKENEILLQRLRDGVPRSAIASELGRTCAALSQRISDNRTRGGLESLKNLRAWDDSDLERLAVTYDKNKTWFAIACISFRVFLSLISIPGQKSRWSFPKGQCRSSGRHIIATWQAKKRVSASGLTDTGGLKKSRN